MRPLRTTTAAACALCALPLAGPPAASAANAANWNRAEQRQVREAGVMDVLADGRFHGERPVTASQLTRAFRALAHAAPTRPVDASGDPVTVEQLNRLVVAASGLADVSAHVQDEAARAGLQPPGRFGDEVIARALGLRHNHPAADDRLELLPSDPATRAHAAHSFAVLLRGTDTSAVRATYRDFRLAKPAAAALAPLRVAVSRIGYPYVWGGEADGTFSRIGGHQAQGGFDCSGLIWRAFKLSGLPAGERITGRTAAQQAQEAPVAARLTAREVRGGDLLFFGTAKRRATATEANTTHAAIALANDWAIHSSSQGVTVLPLRRSWLGSSFTWGRRVVPATTGPQRSAGGGRTDATGGARPGA